MKNKCAVVTKRDEHGAPTALCGKRMLRRYTWAHRAFHTNGGSRPSAVGRAKRRARLARRQHVAETIIAPVSAFATINEIVARSYRNAERPLVETRVRQQPPVPPVLATTPEMVAPSLPAPPSLWSRLKRRLGF